MGQLPPKGFKEGKMKFEVFSFNIVIKTSVSIIFDKEIHALQGFMTNLALKSISFRGLFLWPLQKGLSAPSDPCQGVGASRGGTMGTGGYTAPKGLKERGKIKRYEVFYEVFSCNIVIKLSTSVIEGSMMILTLKMHQLQGPLPPDPHQGALSPLSALRGNAPWIPKVALPTINLSWHRPWGKVEEEHPTGGMLPMPLSCVATGFREFDVKNWRAQELKIHQNYIKSWNGMN